MAYSFLLSSDNPSVLSERCGVVFVLDGTGSLAHHVVKVPAVAFRDVDADHEAQLRQHARNCREAVLVERCDSALFVLNALVVGRTNERPVCALVVEDYAEILVDVP